MFLTLKYSAGPFYSRPPPPLPPPPPGPPLPPLCCSRTATTDTAATVLACTAATGCSSEGLYASLDVSRNLVAPGNSNADVDGQWQRRTNSAGNPNVYFYKSDPYRERHPGFIY